MATRRIEYLIITRIRTVKWNKHFISCSNKQEKNMFQFKLHQDLTGHVKEDKFHWKFGETPSHQRHLRQSLQYWEGGYYPHVSEKLGANIHWHVRNCPKEQTQDNCEILILIMVPEVTFPSFWCKICYFNL